MAGSYIHGSPPDWHVLISHIVNGLQCISVSTGGGGVLEIFTGWGVRILDSRMISIVYHIN